jgi:hypothetical protein
MDTSLRLIIAQERHIRLLTEKLDKLKKNLIMSFTSTPGWPMFVLRHVTSYVRTTHQGSSFLRWVRDCKVEFKFEDDEHVIIKCIKSSSEKPFETNSVEISEIEEFIKDSLYEKFKEKYDGTQWKANFWSTYPETTGNTNNALAIYIIENEDKFISGNYNFEK